MNKLDFIKSHGLTVIFRGVSLEKIGKAVKAVYDGGGRVIEIAFNPSDANTVENTKKLILEARKSVPSDMMIGAGTAVTEEFVQAAYEAGAEFIYSPDTDVDVIKLTKKLGMISIPGALTPSECKTAYKNGADIIKLFPTTINDIGYIINVTKPLSHIPFVCVGGVELDTIEAFIKVGALGVGTGKSIIKPELIESEDWAEIANLTKLHLEKIANARNS